MVKENSIGGQDALIPIKELPAKFLVPAESPEASKASLGKADASPGSVGRG